jgi:hypothetical protein
LSELSERQDMNLLFYAPRSDEPTERLQKVIETILPRVNREIHRDLQGLIKRLYEPSDGRRVLVLCPSKEYLSCIQIIRSLFLSIPVIVVLPDRETETVALGHSLRPRLLTYEDSDFLELAGVLVKMAEAPAHTEHSGKRDRHKLRNRPAP